ncbi:MAG: PRC-barrel domain-containing protein [Endomicrobium sp.]|jgi:16S rRNA processing protein RimM|nr:PRC-barrel domain-containing protein [Endomicrobium sp.]
MLKKSNILKFEIPNDILGFEIFDQSGERVGILTSVLLTNNNDVWIVKYNNKEVFIPVSKNIIKEINVVRKKIFVNFPKIYKNIHGKIKSADGNSGIVYRGYLIYED